MFSEPFDPRQQRPAVGQQLFLVLEQPLEFLPLLFLAAEQVGPQLLFGDDPQRASPTTCPCSARGRDVVVVDGREMEVEARAGGNLERLQLQGVVQTQLRLAELVLELLESGSVPLPVGLGHVVAAPVVADLGQRDAEVVGHAAGERHAGLGHHHAADADQPHADPRLAVDPLADGKRRGPAAGQAERVFEHERVLPGDQLGRIDRAGELRLSVSGSGWPCFTSLAAGGSGGTSSLPSSRRSALTSGLLAVPATARLLPGST